MVRTTTASGWRVETGRPCVHLAHGQRTAPAGRRTGDAVIGHLVPVEPEVEVAGEPMEQAPLGPRHSVGTERTAFGDSVEFVRQRVPSLVDFSCCCDGGVQSMKAHKTASKNSKGLRS